MRIYSLIVSDNSHSHIPSVIDHLIDNSRDRFYHRMLKAGYIKNEYAFKLLEDSKYLDTGAFKLNLDYLDFDKENLL